MVGSVNTDVTMSKAVNVVSRNNVVLTLALVLFKEPQHSGCTLTPCSLQGAPTQWVYTNPLFSSRSPNTVGVH